MKIKFPLAALFVLSARLLFSDATNAIWKPTIAGNQWSNNSNWQNGAAPTNPGDIANFNNVGGGGAVNVDVNENVGTINIDFNVAYTIQSTGGALTLVQSPSTGQALINVTTVNGAAAHTISSNLALGSPLTVTQNSASDFTLSGSISGAQVLTLTSTGTGRLILSAGGGGNSYSLGTAIASGVLSVSNENQLGTGNITMGSGTLQYTSSNTLAHNIMLSGASILDTNGAGTTLTLNSSSFTLSGSGSLSKVGSGTLLMTGTNVNTYQGGTTISAGILSITNDNQLGASTGALSIGTATLATAAGITSARSGTITGSASAINTMGNTSTFSGNFGGGGSLNITGGGVVIFTGTNSYSGPTTVTSSTLQGTTNGIQGNIVLSGANTSLIFLQNFAGTYGGSISSAAPGNGTLSLQGSGTITLSGSSLGFSGPTQLIGGTLIVNGSLGNSTLTTSTNTTLSGLGTLGQTSISGILDPGPGGNGIGRLSINSSLTLNPSAQVTINLTPTANSSIGVTGTASIDGALTINPTSGFYGFNASYTILNSAGLLNVPPGFTSVTSTSPFFTPKLTYNMPAAGDILLEVAVSLPFAVFPFSNENTKAVGKNLDALFAAGELTGDLFNIVQSFAGQSTAAINDALDQMHPAPYSAFTEMLAANDPLLISLFHRLPYLPCNCGCPSRVWIEGFANSLTLKKHGIQFGAQSNTGGIAVGADGEFFVENLFLGVGGAWSNSVLRWHDHHGHGEINGFYGSLYGDYQLGALYLGSALLVGIDYYETQRHLRFFGINRKAKAHFPALDVVAQIQSAYLFGSPLAYFYPYANFDFLFLKTRKFQEHDAGGLDLNVQAHTDCTLRTEMGLALQVEDTNAAETMCISPFVSLGWVNMCPIQREGYHSSFVGTTIPFTTHGWDITWNLLEVKFGLGFTFHCFSVDFDYNVEIAPDKHTIFFNQHGNAKLAYKF